MNSPQDQNRRSNRLRLRDKVVELPVKWRVETHLVRRGEENATRCPNLPGTNIGGRVPTPPVSVVGSYRRRLLFPRCGCRPKSETRLKWPPTRRPEGSAKAATASVVGRFQS